MKANIDIAGVKYPLHFGMRDIQGVLNDIGAGDDFTKASEIMTEASKKPMLLIKVATACAFHGINGYCRKEKTESTFETISDLEDAVSNIGEISAAINEFTTAFMEFFQMGTTDNATKKKASR